MTNTQINLFGLLAIAAGCALVLWVKNQPPPVGRYQVTRNETTFVKTDTATGRVWVLMLEQKGRDGQPGVWVEMPSTEMTVQQVKALQGPSNREVKP